MKNLKNLLKKRVSLVLACVMVAALCVGMTGCSGESDEDVIREGVTAEFESIKNLEQEVLDDLVTSVEASGDMSMLGVDNEEFCRGLLEGFDYSVDEVVVDGDTATVKATMTCKNVSAILTSWTEDVTVFAADPAVLEMTEDELYTEMGTMLMTTIGEAELISTQVELPYEKIDNTWQGTAEAETAITNAMLGQ